MLSRIIYGPRLGRTLWGVEGGDLDHQRVQTHASIGVPGLPFYFTFAVRAFEHWARIRVYGKWPFLWLHAGSMGRVWE